MPPLTSTRTSFGPTISDEAALGRVAGPFSTADVAEFCECPPSVLAIGKLEAVTNPDRSLRLIDGASASGLNHRIRPRGQHECPGLAEGKAIMVWAWSGRVRPHSPPPIRAKPSSNFGIKGTYKLVRKRRKDYRNLVIKVQDALRVQITGACGEGSASGWWSRVDAVLHRMLCHMLSRVAWGLAIVDDGLPHPPHRKSVRGGRVRRAAPRCLGLPPFFPGETIYAGLDLPWAGFPINVNMWYYGLAGSRVADLEALALKTIGASSSKRRLLESMIGKLAHARVALEQLRPLLQPLRAVVSATEGSTTIV